MIVLTKSERRALLLTALILTLSAAIQWLSPHRFSSQQFDYTLQDSLFRVLSADTNKFRSEPLKMKKRAAKQKSTKINHVPQTKRKVNINTANLKTLIQLPRIGPKTAQAIIDYRQQHGPFQKIEELDNVKGIGPKTLEKLRPYIYIKNPNRTK